MNTHMQIAIDDTSNISETLQTLGKGIEVLTNISTRTEEEMKTIQWLTKLLAGGVTELAERMRN